MVSLNSRRKLKPTDADRFLGAEPALFAELARVVCSTGMLPQKELHECWQMAALVNHAYPECVRVADLAAGHGLLAWILVLLARSCDQPVLRTAVAVDIKRPKSADALATAILARWPNLKDSVHYVEGSIDAVTAENGPSTLFVAAHACGSLSDRVLLAAISSQNSVAIMPCCHSLRKQSATLSSLAFASKMPAHTIDGLMVSASEVGQPLSIDQFRIDVLTALGYNIFEDYIQPEITACNRIIMAQHPKSIQPNDASHQHTFEATSSKVKHLGETRAYEKIQSLNVANIQQAEALSKCPSREWRRSFDLSYWIDSVTVGHRLAGILEFLTHSLLHSKDLENREETEEGAHQSALAVMDYLSLETPLDLWPKCDAFVIAVTILDRYSDPVLQRLAFTYRIEISSVTIPLSKADATMLRRTICAALKCLSPRLPEKFELR